MIRNEYDLCIYSYTLKWLLFNKRINWNGKFVPLHTRRDFHIKHKKRIINWNKHTMGTEG